MHDVVAFLKDAVKRGAGAMGVQNCYLSDGAMVRAANDVLHAGIDWPSGAVFALPADAVDAFLSRVDDVKSIDVNERAVVLKSGRLRSSIDLRHDEPEPAPPLPEEWNPVPATFVTALKIAQGFTDPTATGNRLWQSAVRIWSGRVTACNGRCLVDIDVGNLPMEDPKLLGKAAVDFLVTQGNPDEFGTDKNTITFRWDDGRWVRCQVVNTEMSEANLVGIFSKVGTETPCTIDEGFRVAYADAAALSDNTIGLTETGFRAVKENIRSDVEVESDLPEGHSSQWGTKDLGIVLGVATAWNPAAYPDVPALFVGPMMRGVIVGLKS